MITVDKEFESLIPPLSPEEFAQLEENCVKDGIRDPLVVWDSPDGEILVDGHNRWKISASHSGIQFHVVKMHFENRDAVKEWIIKNQFGRRNIPPYMRAWLALKLKPIVAGKAEQRMKAGKADPVQSFAQGKTGDTLAKVAGVSHETIRKVETVEKSGKVANDCIETDRKYRGGFIARCYTDAKRAGLMAECYWETPQKTYDQCLEYIGAWEPQVDGGTAKYKEYLDIRREERSAKRGKA